MYAVIQTGGKQYRVEVGDHLRVEKIQADAGSTLSLDRVLLVSDGDNVTVGNPNVDGTAVTARVVDHGKAKKIKVFKRKRRAGYRKTNGHRQQFTELEITAIGDFTGDPQVEEAPEVEVQEAAEAEAPEEAVTEAADETPAEDTEEQTKPEN